MIRESQNEIGHLRVNCCVVDMREWSALFNLISFSIPPREKWINSTQIASMNPKPPALNSALNFERQKTIQNVNENTGVWHVLFWHDTNDRVVNTQCEATVYNSDHHHIQASSVILITKPVSNEKKHLANPTHIPIPRSLFNFLTSTICAFAWPLWPLPFILLSVKPAIKILVVMWSWVKFSTLHICEYAVCVNGMK